jgi:chromatin remodeling complex protein RSC6
MSLRWLIKKQQQQKVATADSTPVLRLGKKSTTQMASKSGTHVTEAETKATSKKSSSKKRKNTKKGFDLSSELAALQKEFSGL